MIVPTNIIGGKAIVDPATRTARQRLFWFDTTLKTEQVKRIALAFVRACYFEARNIQLWAVPGDDMALDATFDIDVEYLKKDLDRYHPKWQERGIPLFTRYWHDTTRSST